MANFSIPNRPAGSDVRHISDIEADFDVITALLDTGVADRKLVWRNTASVNAGINLSGGQYIFSRNGGLNALGSNYTGINLDTLHLDPADYSSYIAKTAFLMLQVAAVQGITPGVTFTASLRSITLGGAAGAITPTDGGLTGTAAAVLANSSNTSQKVVGGTFAFPAAGLYAVAMTTSASTAANSQTILEASLWLSYR